MSQSKGNFVFWNGDFLPRAEAVIPIDWHVVRYGSGTFEGIRGYQTERGVAIPFLAEHARRLYHSAKIHGMTDAFHFSPEQIAEAIIATVKKNGIVPCYINPMIFRGGGSLNVNPMECDVVFVVDIMVWGKYVGDAARVKVSSWTRPAPNTHPMMAKAGGNYLNGALMKMEAVRLGYVEGIGLTPAGHVSDGSGENIFLVVDNTIWTPPLADCGLPGLTRQHVIILARENGWEVREESIPREMLYTADEIFFTGSAAEITPIQQVDHIELEAPGPKTAELQKKFGDTIQGSTQHSQDWITYFQMD